MTHGNPPYTDHAVCSDHQAGKEEASNLHVVEIHCARQMAGQDGLMVYPADEDLSDDGVSIRNPHSKSQHGSSASGAEESRMCQRVHKIPATKFVRHVDRHGGASVVQCWTAGQQLERSILHQEHDS